MSDTPVNSPGAPEGRPVGAHYVAHDILGTGAMGEVRRGLSDTGELVAIKLLHPSLAGKSGLVSRFVNERTILTGLSGDNLVRVRDLVVDGPTLAIVMDLVQGGDLRAHLEAAGTLPPAEAAALVVGVLRGLATVHAAGVVHRDVKPENVLLDRSVPGALPVPKVADFGVSKLATGLTSGQTSVIGTPVYMAPELLDADPTTTTDLYAVGIVLYELLCGVTPFVAANPLTLMRQHAEQSPGRPQQVPDELWAVISVLLAKDPADRPSSAAAVAARLESLQPVLLGLPAAPRLTEPPAAEDGTVLTTPSGLRPAPVVAPVGPPPGGVPVKRKRRTGLVAASVLVVLALAGGGTALALSQGDKTEAGNSSEATPTSAPDVTGDPTPTPTTDASAGPTPTDVQSGPTGLLPDFKGMKLADVVSALAERGLKYDVKDIVGSGAPEGTVISTVPAAGQPAGELVTLNVARSVVRTYLEDVPTVKGDPDSGVFSISGKEYLHGISLRLDSYSCVGSVTSLEYDLGRQSSRLVGIAGLTDTSDSARVVQVEVLGDGRLLTKKPVSLGRPQRLEVDVTGVLRLAIRSTTTACGNDDRSTLAFGDAALLGLPNAQPS